MTRQSFGELIVYLRKQKNLKQNELAAHLHVTPSAVNKWEKGSRMPDILTLEQMADYFQISIDDLYHPEETLLRLQKEEAALTETKKGFGFFRKKPAIILSAFCLLTGTLLILFLTIGPAHTKTDPTEFIRLTAIRHTEDFAYGTCCDFALFYSGKLNEKLVDDMCERTLSIAKQNHFIHPQEKVYRFYFYRDEDDAINWRKHKLECILFEES